MLNRSEPRILILGNGFDLAHDLPTSYMNFIDFIEFFNSCRFQANPENYISDYAGKLVKPLVEKYLMELFRNPVKVNIKSEFESLLSGNIWLNYFISIKIKSANTWIDFETEISRVIQSMYGLLCNFERGEALADNYEKLTPHIFDIIPQQIDEIYEKRDILIADLRRLSRALELYLADFVNNIPVHKRIPEIQNAHFDKIICFNYTNTYQRLYHSGKITEIEYIHGNANINSNVETCNLVLGIDEFLDPLIDDVDTDFIEFKKFYQRIWKRTGGSYVKWLEDIKKHKLRTHIFIYGHSLDITDKDILRPFILLEKSNTKVYYHSKPAFGNQIKKLTKLLGEDNLVKYVYERKIGFLPQENLL